MCGLAAQSRVRVRKIPRKRQEVIDLLQVAILYRDLRLPSLGGAHRGHSWCHQVLKSVPVIALKMPGSRFLCPRRPFSCNQHFRRCAQHRSQAGGSLKAMRVRGAILYGAVLQCRSSIPENPVSARRSLTRVPCVTSCGQIQRTAPHFSKVTGFVAAVLPWMLKDLDGWGLSPRGAGYLFGADVVKGSGPCIRLFAR